VRRPGDPLPHREATQGRLVLGTAEGSPFVPENVVYVDALLTSPVQPSPPRMALDLAPSEKILAGDSSAWFFVLLWIQGLTLAVLALSWARVRWGRGQAWLVGVPVLAAMGIGTANTVVQLLPNVL
jgi:sortase A